MKICGYFKGELTVEEIEAEQFEEIVEDIQWYREYVGDKPLKNLEEEAMKAYSYGQMGIARYGLRSRQKVRHWKNPCKSSILKS